MKVTRKGSVISTLDADWLELTTFYYKQGLSLIDSFVHWDISKGKCNSGNHISLKIFNYYMFVLQHVGQIVVLSLKRKILEMVTLSL